MTCGNDEGIASGMTEIWPLYAITYLSALVLNGTWVIWIPAVLLRGFLCATKHSFALECDDHAYNPVVTDVLYFLDRSFTE